MRKLLLVLAVLALFGCGREETVTKGSPPLDIDLPYYGKATLEERILGAEVIARVRLRSVEALGTFVPGSSGSEYLPALDFTFDALEYLHGSGGDTLVARAYGYIDDGSWVFPTVSEAEETARTEVMDFRDKRWDGREAIVFLRRPLKGGEPYRLGSIGSDWHAEEGRVLFSKLTVADDKYQAWLPDASVPGASGGEQRFLLDDPGSGVSSVSTITLSSLKFRIAELGGTASGYEGETDEVRRCLAFKSLQERRIAAEKAAGTFGSVYLYDVESGMAAGTPVYKSESPEIRRLFPDAGLPAHEEFGGGRASRYGGGWFSGSANELFRALQVHHTTTEGVYIAGPSLHTRRPLPSGEYRTYYNFRYALGPDCGYSSHGSDEEFKLVITVTSPRGTLAESFFDPYADGAAVTGTTTAGTIRWESGRVEAALTVDVSDHVLYFIGLDGTVTLSLAVDDATEASGELRWTVATQPWSAGDKLMLRIRGIGCQGGVAVADPASNPGLVSDCDALLEAKEVLAVTGTLNWDVDTAITRWDGVMVGGTPQRVTGLVLFQHVLGGSIPPVLGDLTGLERLEMSANGLTGEIPWQLGDLTNLRTLYLRYNELTGEIPPELGKLSNVTVLWLQGNELRGAIPWELGNMSSLEDLGLAGNRLTATIPGSLGRLTRLERLWAYDNQLSGDIPPELGDLTALEHLELQDNDLIGPVPWELGNVAALDLLRLSGNRLEGCLRPALRRVTTNDFVELGLPYCANDGRVPSPTGFSVSLTDDTFSMSWGSVAGADAYEVRYRIGDDERETVATTTASTAATYSPEDGPECGSTYKFHVRARGDGTTYVGGLSAESAVQSVTTGACNRAPEFASSTYAFLVSEDAATSTVVGTVTATDPDEGDSLTYTIVAGYGGGRFALGADSGGITVVGALDYEDISSYTLVVEARDGRGGADTTTVAITVTDVLETAPAPGGVSVLLSGGAFAISWDALTGASLYGGQHRVVGSGADWSGVGTTTATLLTYSPEDGLICGTTYEFRVRAYGDGTVYLSDWGEPSAAEPVIYDSTYDACSQPPVFGGPYSFTVAEDAPTGHLVGTVSATDPDEGDVATFEITAGDDVGAFAMGESSGTITVAGELDHETAPTHSLTVEADDDRGGTATTSVEIVVTNVIELPGVPRNLSATLDGPWVRLEWDAPDDGTVTGYQVLRRQPSIHALGVFDVIVENSGGTDTVYVDRSVEPRTQYVYRVKAVNSDGASGRSGYVSLTTGGAPAPAPGGLSVSLAEGVFTIAWAAVAGAARYEVEYRIEGSGDDWAAVGTTEATEVTHSPEGGPGCSTTYEFRVRSYGDGTLLAAAWGEYSEPESVATGSCPPEFGERSYAFAVLESAATSTLVGRVTASDPDAGNVVMYEITSGNDAGVFAIDSGTGEITLVGVLDRATTPSYSLTVEASDGRGGAVSVPVTVTVGAAGCSGGIAVTDPGDNPGLVSECETLLGLKAALAGTGALNWNDATAITSWDGVTVGGSPRRVTELSLRFRGLTGVIPPGLGDLSGLQVLNLSVNGLTGGIPAELGGLSNLNTLWLYQNQLTGGIPSELGMLTDLIWIAVHENGLTGGIPGELGGLTNLSHLLLYGNRLSGELPVELSEPRYMTVVQLNDNQLSGPIPPEWSSLSGLSILDLSGNALEGCRPPSWRSRGLGGSLGLPYCGQAGRVPSPQGVSASVSGATFTVGWSAVAGAGMYEVQHRIEGSGDEWTRAATSTAVSLTYSPVGGAACETSYEFRVRAYGDGTTYAGVWGVESGAEPVATEACNRAPEFASSTYRFVIAEDSATTTVVGTVTATDPDTDDTVAYTITAGNEDDDFSIDENTGAITVESALDHEATPMYRLGVGASDGRGGVDTASVEITVTDVAEDLPPAPQGLRVTLADATFSINWNVVTGASHYEAQHHIVGSEDDWSSVGTTTSTALTYSPVGGPACGTTYEFRVRAYGDGTTYAGVWGVESGAEPVATEACNRAPEFASSTYRFVIAEDSATTTVVGTVTATDPDTDDTVAYTITAGNEDDDFSIDENTGAITVESALDHETTPMYRLGVEASDGRGGVDTASVEITVTDVAEDLPPAPQGLRVTLADATFSISWNVVTGASHYEAQHHIVGSEDDWSSVGTTPTTALTYSPVGGAECGTTYEFRVRAYGDGTVYVAGWGPESDSESVTTSECDRAPRFGSSFYSFSIAEDSATSTSVGSVSATDADEDAVTYLITGGNEDGKFSIGSVTGEITLEGSVDPDVVAFYALTVEASDGNGNTANAGVGVSLLLEECSNGTAVPSPRNNPTLVRDCSMLLAARDTLAGEGSLDWSAETRINDWQGVTVHRRPFAFVRVLYLTELGLTGSIPPELGGLADVRRIDLDYNMLTGGIPPELGSLPDLEQLYLQGNRLSGEIPVELGNLRNLQVMYLSDNMLTGGIPPELGRLRNLQQLILDGNPLEGEIPPELGNLSRLEHLLLRDNGLTGGIPTELEALSNLRHLYLQSNGFTGCIPAGLRDVENNDLDRLGLGYCGSPGQ